ncbi:hypothetical protein NLI96_g6036 [Meripilus lineatus]|uniref:DUF6533 domain-containing protein n=1 Tax=Meripilus lineatus TaxID=2056292 RepID=A0AAD5YIH6_9APHY|nr:hypothetical protein NLI96_g6036 [Physisporinus lineatus]
MNIPSPAVLTTWLVYDASPRYASKISALASSLSMPSLVFKLHLVVHVNADDSNFDEIPALLIFDHLLSLSAEAELVWKKEKSGVMIIFLLIRYCTLISKVLQFWGVIAQPTVLVLRSREYLNEVKSNVIGVTGAAALVFGFLSSTGVYVWGKSWRVAILVGIIGWGILCSASLPILDTILPACKESPQILVA